MESLTEEVEKARKPGHEISPSILNRWSPRSMTGEGIGDRELMALFEAARWAPSSFNNQPWRFVYAKRDSEYWGRFLGLLNEWNRKWAEKAAVLVVVLSKTTFDYKGRPSRTHAFDAGAAWENLAIEGSTRGLVVHAMEGFDYDKAREAVGAPDDHEVHCMVAIGRRGRTEDLPEQKMRDQERPSGRRPLNEIVMEGGFG